MSPQLSQIAKKAKLDPKARFTSLAHLLTPGLDRMVMFNWAADERGLFVTRNLLDGYEIIYGDLAGRTHSLWRNYGGWCQGRSSPDGRHLAVYDVEKSNNIWMMENF